MSEVVPLSTPVIASHQMSSDPQPGAKFGGSGVALVPVAVATATPVASVPYQL